MGFAASEFRGFVPRVSTESVIEWETGLRDGVKQVFPWIREMAVTGT